MQKIILLCSLFFLSSCHMIHEKKMDIYILFSDDNYFNQSYRFLKENLSERDWRVMVSQQELFMEDLKCAIDSNRKSLETGEIPFDIFCEYVLPLRVYTEPVENWREDCINMYGYLKGERTGYVCDRINFRFMEQFRYGPRINSLPKSWSQLKKMTSGDCYDMAQAPIFPLRAIGIPATIDFIYGWGNANGLHAWDVAYIDGKMCPFMGIEEGPDTYSPFYVYDYFPDPTRSGYRYPPKVYRKTPVVNKEILSYRKILVEEDIPTILRDVNVRDVTSEYFFVKDVMIPYEGSESLAYLSVYNTNLWLPAVVTRTDKTGFLTFRDLNTNMLYLPSHYKNRQTISFDYPFILTDEGDIINLIPDENKKQPLTVVYLQPILFDYLNAKANEDKLPVNALIQMSKYDAFREQPINNAIYKLYYWSESGWEFLSEEKASDNKLYFTGLPYNALFRITKTGEPIGRCFTVEDNNMIWW